MIPILYAHDETSFASNGLGRLADAISCTVTEEINGIYELELVYPVTGRHYEEMVIGNIICATHDNGKTPEPFDIYRRSAPLNGQVTFNARHVSYRLNSVIVEPFEAESCTAILSGIRSHSINNNPFTFYNSVSGTATFEMNHPMSVRALLMGSDKMSVLNLFNGEFSFTRFRVNHTTRRGSNRNVSIRYGKNLTELTHEVDGGEMATAVVPYWLSGDGAELAMLPEKYIALDTSNPTERMVTYDMSQDFDIYPEEEDLREGARKALLTSNIPKENLQINFYQLWETGEYEEKSVLLRCYMGDTVKVIYTELGVTSELRIVKTVYDTILDRFVSMELGQMKPSYSSVLQKAFEDTIKQIAPTKTDLEAALTHATEMITGGTGGYVVFGFNGGADDEQGRMEYTPYSKGKLPSELYFLDTPSPATAVNCLRINYKGMGFSNQGINGPFNSAWTLDSSFVADFITAGFLNANLVQISGLLKDKQGNVKWDMEAGSLEAKLNSLKLIANGTTKTVDQIASDSASSAADAALTQQAIFNRLTENPSGGQPYQGIFYDENGNVYINMTYLKAGILKIGGNANQIGLLEVYNNSGDLMMRVDNTGQTLSHTVVDQLDGTEYEYQTAFSPGKLKSSRGIKSSGTLHDFASLELAPLGGLTFYDFALRALQNPGVGIIQAETIELRGSSDSDWLATFSSSGITFDKTVDIIAGLKLSNMGTPSTVSSVSTYLDIGTGGRVVQYNNTSSKRYKQVFKTVRAADIKEAYKVKIYMGRYKPEVLTEGDQREGLTYPMFVVEQMQRHLPIAVDLDQKGRPDAWNHKILIPIMYQMIKDQKARNDELEGRVADLEARLARLETMLS